MSFPKYPDYKDSGVEWLGEVPAHWEVAPLRGAAKQEAYSFTDGDWVESPFITDEGVRLIQTGNIGVGKYREQGFRYISEDTFRKLNCTELFPGDVLICRLADPVGRACLAPDLGARMITSVDVCILKTKREINSNFLVYFLSSKSYLSFMSSVSRGGTRERVSRSFLGGVRILMPSVDEQSTIAAFLDYETARIDALVEQQQRLIELLKEKRQAVISHAVTKGLNPDVPMKDSGVEWLGEVPAHWDMPQFRRFTSLSQGLQIPQSERFHEPGFGRVKYLTVRLLNSGDNSEGADYIDAPSKRVVCCEEDVLLARTGATGEVITNVSGAFHNNFFKVDYDRRLIVKGYLVCLLNVSQLKSHLRMLAGTTTIPDLNHGEFLGVRVPLPPLFEQQQIVEKCNEASSKYEAAISHALQQVRLLKERRSALISAAVTGKIDVRGWQPPAGSSATSVTKQTEVV